MPKPDKIEIVINKIRQKYTVLSNYIKTFGFTDIDEENEFCNVLLSITRWIIWKRRCIFKYEHKYMEQEELFSWIHNDFKQSDAKLFVCGVCLSICRIILYLN